MVTVLPLHDRGRHPFFRIVCRGGRNASVWAALDGLGRFVDGKVIHRQRLGIRRGQPRDRALQVHPLFGGPRDVLVAPVTGIRIHQFRLTVLFFQLLDHRDQSGRVRAMGRLDDHARN